MRRLSRVILVLCTALAAFVAASLQDKVLCYSDCGRHFAIEAPHADTGCPAGHEGHEHPGPEHGSELATPDSAGCTDVSAEFPVVREVAPASLDARHVELAVTPAVSLTRSAAWPRPAAAPALDGHPPPPDLGRLRTVVLLV